MSEGKYDISIFFSGEEFCNHINGTDYIFDIVLMDIEMGQISGVDAGRKLRENILNDQTLLIYISAHKKYHDDIINLKVFGFVYKPIIQNQFFYRLDEAVRLINSQRQNNTLPVLTIYSNKKEIVIPLSTIMYLESKAREICLTTTKDVFYYYSRLDDEEPKLCEPNGFSPFVRTHQSFIVNFDHAKIVSASKVVMNDEKTILISRNLRKKVYDAYSLYREMRI